MANRLEYVHLADLGAIVNANNPTPFSPGEINWVLQVSLRATCIFSWSQYLYPTNLTKFPMGYYDHLFV